MALEDRDWYRERPSDAWNRQRDGSPDRPAASRGFASARVHPGAWLAIAVSVVAVAFTWKFGLLEIPLSSGERPAQAAEQRPSTDVDLSGNPALRVRAAAPTTWTISDPRFGTIKVHVAAGELPLTVVARALAQRGYTATLPANVP